MEEKPKFNTLKILIPVLAILIVITITLTINKRNISEKQNIFKAFTSNMVKRDKMIFEWGVRALGMKVMSECFHKDPEDLKNVPEKDIIEFRFKDGKIGRIKRWKTTGEK